jgi:hypothetical protein
LVHVERIFCRIPSRPHAQGHLAWQRRDAGLASSLSGIGVANRFGAGARADARPLRRSGTGAARWHDPAGPHALAAADAQPDAAARADASPHAAAHHSVAASANPAPDARTGAASRTDACANTPASFGTHRDARPGTNARADHGSTRNAG